LEAFSVPPPPKTKEKKEERKGGVITIMYLRKEGQFPPG